MIVCLLSLLLFDYASSAADRIIVNTNKGPISGQKGDGEFTTFFGVPYAKVDERNPFGNSIDYPLFNAPFDASDPFIKCPQVFRSEGGTLQCLILNIYVPTTANLNQSLPILVWFYGGGFVMGSAGEYGGKYLVKHNIIVVTVNYRLGPYGFLCLNDISVPGNQGLKDQVQALRWIKENIGAFGGDRTKVTIAGESYGGGSVDLHLYSMVEKLFDKAIIQSGSIFTQGMFVKGNHEAAIELSNYLGHNTRDTKDALVFLSQTDPLQVMRAARNLSLQLMPCKEKKFENHPSFFPYDIIHALKDLKDVSIMIGHNSKETFGTFANKPDDFYAGLKNIFYEKTNEIFILQKNDLETLANMIQKFYLGGKSISKESMLELIDFTADVKLNHAVDRSVNNYVKEGNRNIYKYLFSYIGGSPYKNISGVGSYHTEELQYLFEMKMELNSDEQIMMRDRMTEMWANFVKYGNPTPKVTELLPIKWVPITKGWSRPYLNIDMHMSIHDHLNHERMAFWDVIWRYNEQHSVITEHRHRKRN